MKKITKNIHHSVYIDENVLIGKNTKIWHFSHISQNVKIGKNCSLGQNIFVELFLYYDQLGEGKNLSWAPLIPTGNIFNPVLFEFNGRSVSFQTQLENAQSIMAMTMCGAGFGAARAKNVACGVQWYKIDRMA